MLKAFFPLAVVALLSSSSSWCFSSITTEARQPDRIIARYTGPRGRRLIRRCAKNVIRDFDDDDIVIIETEDPKCLRLLQGDENVIEADMDYPVEGLGGSVMLRGANGEMKHVEGREQQQALLQSYNRELQEETPWGIEMIQAHQLEAGDHEVTVCIVDTGLAVGHPDFDQSNINGTDTVKFYGPEWKWDRDMDGHGTHVAGTIAAKSGNGRGVVGVSSKLKLHIVRALGDDGRGYESDIRAAVEQCVEAGANVINLSLGGLRISSRSARFYDSYVNQYGIMMVAAAGNDGTTANVFPAAHTAVISVSAVADTGMRWGYSNHGNQIEISAPGQRILSTTASSASVEVENGYAYVAHTVSNSLKERVSGELVECQSGRDECRDARGGGVCLFQKENGDQVGAMLDACIEGGGVAAIIFNSDGSSADNLRVNPRRDIVAVGINKNFAMELINDGFVGETVTVGDDGADDQEYAYAILSGTSMASPHVAAGAGLLMTHFPLCTNHQIRYAMAVTADHPNGGNDHCDTQMGYGVLKVKDAYDWLMDNDCSTWDVSQRSRGGCTTLHQGIEPISQAAGGLQGV